MTTYDDLAAKARAAEAEAPGEWFFAYNRICCTAVLREFDRIERTLPDDIADDDPRWDALPEPNVAWVEASHGDTASLRGMKLAQHIAAASPSVVLALLADLRAARARVEKMERVVEAAGNWRRTMRWECSRADGEIFTCEQMLVEALDALGTP